MTVRAAGGVLYRESGDGLEVCLVHRPRYDDWALPKGKLADGEQPLAGAVREVLEETGTGGIPQLRLPEVAYTLPDGRRKTVEFWLMRGGSSGPALDGHEVDAVEWLPLSRAFSRMTYPDERDLMAHVAGLPRVTAVAALVRHAHAGERKKWVGNDALRPIDPIGQAQAERLAGLLTLLGPERLVAATPLRCKQTLEPLAAALGGMPIVADGAFTEPPSADEAPAKADAAVPRLLALRAAGPVVICSQGKLMPRLIATLLGDDDAERYKTPKGGGWILTWSGGRLMGLSRL